jgi:hypothetical protein
MKFLAIIGLFFGLAAHAEVANSKYSARHQSLLQKAVYDACGAYGQVTQLSTTEVEDRIDQGVIDTYYTTQLELYVRIDQGVRDTYLVEVKSAQYSAYDHEAKDWGIYEILSASCELQ